jgi:hypothetical protein
MISTISLAQSNDKYPVAPEIWSKPEEIKPISDWAGEVDGISVSANGKMLYLGVAGIALTELTDTGWATPHKLNSKINVDVFIRDPCITPNGKRLFYTRSGGSFYYSLYYSDWDTVTNDWGDATDCGSEINMPNYSIEGCTAPDDSTIIFLPANTSYIAHWNNATKTWGNVAGWGHDSLAWFWSNWGINVLQNRKKVYLITPQSDTTNGQYYLKEDLTVNYQDSIDTLTYDRRYALNISYQADTLYYKGEYLNRFQGYPTLTADGKTLFFVAKYHGKQTVYFSHMLIDENGSPVTSIYESNRHIVPDSFNLGIPYPNPFNPNTTIEYQVNRVSKITIAVYNILGEKVKELYSGINSAGKYKTIFNATGLPSGVYLISLVTPFGYHVQKSIYLK